jgi:hypothetical protein
MDVLSEVEAQVRAICLGLPEVTKRLSHGTPAFFVLKQFVMIWPEGHHDACFFRPPRRDPRLAGCASRRAHGGRRAPIDLRGRTAQRGSAGAGRPAGRNRDRLTRRAVSHLERTVFAVRTAVTLW